jgi:hypothetical protein
MRIILHPRWRALADEVEEVTAEGLASGTLSWFEGFSLAMCILHGIITSLGYTIAVVGAYVQNYLDAEMAMMFPRRPAGSRCMRTTPGGGTSRSPDRWRLSATGWAGR